MMFLGVIGVIGAYPIFWNERRVYSPRSLSDASFQKRELSLARPGGGNDKVGCANWLPIRPLPYCFSSCTLFLNPWPTLISSRSQSLLKKKKKISVHCRSSLWSLDVKMVLLIWIMKRCCLFIALFIALQTFFYNFHLSEAELFDELLTLEVFYLAIYAACNILPRGYSWEFLVRVCPRFSSSQTYFRPKKCHLSHSFLDLASKIHTRFQTSPLRNYVITTSTWTAGEKVS